MIDEFPTVALGAWVQARQAVIDDGAQAARKGDLGHVIEKRPGYLPTILWERTGRVCDAEPGADFDVLCRADFASTPETTPCRKDA